MIYLIQPLRIHLYRLLFFIFLTNSCTSIGQQNHLEQAALAGTGIIGQVIAISDVSGVSNTPMEATILLISPQNLDALLLVKGFSERNNTHYPNLFFALTGDEPQRYVSYLNKTDKDGVFRLESSSGKWWLCLGLPNSSGVTLYGCASVEIEAGKWLNKKLFWGEAGFQLE